MTVFSQKAWRHCSSAHSGSLDGQQERHGSGEGHGFLSVVFTRALKAGTRCPMAVVCNSNVDSSKPDSCESTYLNEICLSVKPCDVVFDGSVLASFLSLLVLPAHPEASEYHRPLSDTTAAVTTQLPFLNSSSLPLIYVNSRDFRLFVPAVERSSNGQGDAVALNGRSRLPYSCGDVCILHVGSINVVPYAVNPLARLVVEKTAYSKALLAGLTNRVGSEIEDRQYQMDIGGLGVSTGRWNELVMDENAGGSLLVGVTSENPAFAWNTLLSLPNARYVSCFVWQFFNIITALEVS